MSELVEREILLHLGRGKVAEEVIAVRALCSDYLAIHPTWCGGAWSDSSLTLTHIPTGRALISAYRKVVPAFLRMAERSEIDWSQDKDGIRAYKATIKELHRRWMVIERRWFRLPFAYPPRLRYRRPRPTLPRVLEHQALWRECWDATLKDISISPYDLRRVRHGRSRYIASPPRCVRQRITRVQVPA